MRPEEDGCRWTAGEYSPNMIYSDPHEVLLNHADVVTLFDPSNPSWNEVVVSVDAVSRFCSRDFMVIEIPVDSDDALSVDGWRDRIARARE